MLAQTDNPFTVDPWAFVPHPEVGLLVAFLTGAYVYMVRVIGPKAVAPGESPVSRRNIRAFTAAMLILWVSSDWPIHDISEDYLYWVHMFQHMALSFFVPPLALIATPKPHESPSREKCATPSGRTSMNTPSASSTTSPSLGPVTTAPGVQSTPSADR